MKERLVQFRAWSLAKLYELEKLLREKYPGRADQITTVVEILSNKLYYLNKYSLADYMYTLKILSKQFPELAELIPSTETVQQLYEDEG